MSEISPERTYYIRTSLMYTNLTRDVLFKLFRFLAKSEDLAGFLSSPDQQNKLHELRKRKILNETDYNLVSGHVVNLEKFDISLMIRLILNLCKVNIPQPQLGRKTKPHPKDESLGADLLRLRDVRNKLIGHRGNTNLSESEYEHTWEKVKAILLRVVAHVDPDDSECFERRLDEYKQLEIDTEDSKVKKLLAELLEYKREIDILQEKVEELATKSQEFQVYFKTTPERFARYIKLLFMGGRVVLSGILARELGDQDLSNLLVKHQETLEQNIEKKALGCLFPEEPDDLDYKTWDIYLLASVLLLVFKDNIKQEEVSDIELIKEARLNYADCACSSLDTDDFLTIWTDLINCLNHLSMNISKDYKHQVENLITVHKKKDDKECDAEEYFQQLKESGIEVKTLNDVYNETSVQLKDMLKQLSQKGVNFKKDHVLEIKILTTCGNEEIKKKAEDLLEMNLQASLQGLDHQSEPIGIETDNLVTSIAAHPDVKPGEMKRKCIILSFKSSTPGGLIHILDYLNSDQFRTTLNDIASELHYMYGYVFLLQGHFTLESLSRLKILIGSTEKVPNEEISIPLKCSSVDGMKSVLSELKRERTINSLNRIAEQISEEVAETVAIKVFPDLMEFRDVFDETDSERSSSFGKNEESAEEMVTGEMDKIQSYSNNEEDYEYSEKRNFESISKPARAHEDDEEYIDFVLGNEECKTTNVHKRQHMDDEIGNKSTYNYEATVVDIETVESSFHSFDTSDERTKGEAKAEKYDLETVCQYLKEGLKGVVSSFSQRDFLALRSKVLKNPNTVECNDCLLNFLLPAHTSVLPAHTSVSNRCPLGQESCNCLYTRNKKPCPGNFCSVIYDEIIKRHRYSSVKWYRKNHKTNWHQNDLEMTEFFIENILSFERYTCIEDLECIDLLDIMINNVEFQNEVSFQIDPPFDVLSKNQSHENLKHSHVYREETNSNMRISNIKIADTEIDLDDMVNDVITILTDKKTICNIPSAQKAILDLQELRNRERKYRTSEMESITSIYIKRGCQRESDKYKEFTEFPDQRKIGREKKSDSSDKNDDDTMIQASLHGNYSLCTQEDAMEKKPKPDSPPITGTLSAKPHSYEEISVENDYDQLLIETETTIEMNMDSTKKISEKELLDLQDKVEYLIKTRESLGSVLFQSTKLDSVRERFLQMKQTYLSKDDYYWEYKFSKKQITS